MRKNKIAVLLAAAIAISSMSGCATPPSNQQGGAVIGGILGGVLGSTVGKGNGRTAAIIAGTLAGGLIGGAIGQSMDEVDRMKMQNSLERSPTGSPSSWRNPDTGNHYSVTPTRTYETSGGVCRDYTTSATIDGRPETVRGTACRQPNGEWRVQ